MHSIKVGTRFVGNVNGATMEIVKLQFGRDGEAAVAVIKDMKTGDEHLYGLEALKRCDISIVG